MSKPYEKPHVIPVGETILTELRAENAKLRELLQEAVDGISTKDIRDWRFGKRLAFLRKLRELGIEEDE